MKPTLSRRSLGLGLALLLSGVAASAMAETHVVKMYSFDAAVSDQADYFDPPLIQVAVGDTVRFEATQSGHNTASKKGMIPEGTESWNSPMDVDFEITFTADGTYDYICSPHYSMGMVGLVLVGDYSVNLEEARKVKHRGKAKAAFRALFEQVDALQ